MKNHLNQKINHKVVDPADKPRDVGEFVKGRRRIRQGTSENLPLDAHNGQLVTATTCLIQQPKVPYPNNNLLGEGMFHGSMVALVTPFKNDKIDEPRLRALVDWHIEQGTHAIIAAGTTGESGTLSHDEKLFVIKTVLHQAREQVPVIAGTAMNGTKDCIALTKEAMHLGAHAALIMTPAYIKPTQEGLFLHYSAIAKAVAIPIILYNVPGRTACDLLPETVMRLAQFSNIIGIKEATGKIDRLKAILEGCGDTLDVYSGDDATALEWLLNGAKGNISVTANVIPKLMAKLCDAALGGDKETALMINEQIKNLHELLFIEANPIPVKWCLAQMGLIDDELRLPLTSLSKNNQTMLKDTLTTLNLK